MNSLATTTAHPTQLGRFVLLERLGAGGMAEVWKARITGPMGFARKVCVKRILPELARDPRFVEMFIEEARLSSELSHANIVQVYEFGSIDGEFFLAMEWVYGRDLMALLRAVRAVALPPVGMAAYVARDVCRALAYAHALTSDDGQPLGIVHRDVSPSNVMIGFDGSVKLLDFGIAKALGEVDVDRAHARVLKGKLAYMAPEQIDDDAEIDGRADQFSTGVLLWEMLAGRRLFKAQTEWETLELVKRAETPPPSIWNPEVPLELERVCLKMLARDPADRFLDCADAAAALDEVVLALKWTSGRMGHLMRAAFPMASYSSISQPIPLVTPAPTPEPERAHEPTPATVETPRYPRPVPAGAWAVFAALICALLALAWVVATR